MLLVKRSNVHEWILVCAAVLHSGYALLTVYPNQMLVIVFALMMTALLKLKRLEYNLPILCFLITIMVVSLFSGIYNESNVLSSIKLMLVVFLSFLFVNVIDYKRFVRLYVGLMLFLSIVSLFFYVLVNVANFNLSTAFPIVTNVNDMSYYNAYLNFMFASPYMKYRNTSIFWEPGIFSSYLVIAMLIVKHGCFRREKLIMAIFMLTILSAYSTAGYVLLIFSIVAIYSHSMKRQLSIVLLFCIILPLGFYFENEVINFLRVYFPEVTSKFFVTESASIIDRIQSPLLNLQAFSISPIFGNGIYSVDEMYAQASGFAQTSTSTLYLASFGCFGLTYTALLFHGTWLNDQFKTSNILLFIIVFIILNKEPHMFFILTYIILFYWSLESSRGRREA